MSKNDLPQFTYDEIEFDDQLALIDGTPVTGKIIALYPNGAKEIEFYYVDGLPEGLQKRWYDDGKIEEEWEAIRGRGSAWTKSWYPNGQLKRYRTNNDGLAVIIQEWDENGTLIRDESFG